jgi:outer membrane protein assembly factor BamA
VTWLVGSITVTAQDTAPSGATTGWVTPTPGLIAEPALLRKVVDHTDGVSADGERNDGPYVGLGNMITGAGWISAGPGYQHHVLDGRALVDVSAAVSWRLYKVAQGRFELPKIAHDRLSLGGQASYQDLTQVNYFGLGSVSLKADRSAYRLHNFDILGYATVRATSSLSVSGRFGWIPDVNLSTATGRNLRFPNTSDLFIDSAAPGIQSQPSLLHGDVSVAADLRDRPGHPTSGGFYRAAAAAYSDRDTGTYSFRRYEIEASQFVPLFTRKWVVALHGWEVFSQTSSGDLVPFYLMPSLGGQNTLRGYYDYRFHDNDLQSFTAESRWALFAHVDAAAFADAGKVTPRAGDLDFRHLKTSYGAGLRVHNAMSTIARLDIGHSTEGWRVFFKLTDPLKRSTPASGRSAVVPFVP